MSSCAIATNSSMVMTCGKHFTPYIFNNGSKFRFKVLAGVLTIICILSTFQNSMVLLVMLKEKNIRKIQLNKFLMVLTSIDLLVATIPIPLYTAYTILLSQGHFCCLIGNLLIASAFSFLTMSVTAIAFVTFQLYLAILHPFFYTGKWNAQIALPLLMSLNVVLAIFTLVMVFVLPAFWPIYRTAVSSFVFITYLVMCCLHLGIHRETKKLRKRSSINRSLKQNRVSNKTLKLATSVLISFGLCYLPYIALTVYTMVEEFTPYINTYFEPWAEILGISTCVWDPLLYCIRLGSIRKRVVGVICRKRICDIIKEPSHQIDTNF